MIPGPAASKYTTSLPGNIMLPSVLPSFLLERFHRSVCEGPSQINIEEARTLAP
jgi:hypothetical protein